MSESFTIETKKTFSDDEMTQLYGQSRAVARKHNCSTRYVNFIIKGEREVDSELSQNIYNTLTALLELLNT